MNDEDLDWPELAASTDGGACGLTPAQQLAVDALVAGARLPAAAGAARVSERTLRRWRCLPAFRDALRMARREAFSDALATIRGAMTDAAQALQDVAADSQAPPQARVNAARVLLDVALKSGAVAEAADDKQDTALMLAGLIV